MRAVQIRELGVELSLGLLTELLGHSLPPPPARATTVRRRERSRAQELRRWLAARAPEHRPASPTAGECRPRCARSRPPPGPVSSRARSGIAAERRRGA